MKSSCEEGLYAGTFFCYNEKKGGVGMPSNEKEYNGYLFDQLSILEEIEEVAKETNDIDRILKTVEKLKKRVNRKLYQQPPVENEI